MTAVDILLVVAASAFSAWRTSVLYSQKRWLLVVGLLLGSISPGLTAYAMMALTKSAYESPLGSTVCTSFPGEAFSSWLMGSRAASIVFDGFVLILTWYKARTAGHYDPEFLALQPLSTIFLRDTAQCFSFLLIYSMLLDFASDVIWSTQQSWRYGSCTSL